MSRGNLNLDCPINKLKIMKFTTLCILGIVFFSCKKNSTCYQGNNQIISETRSVENFHHVDLSTSANVYIEQASNYQIIVETSKNLQSVIQTDVQNGLLSISSKKDKCIQELEILNIYVKAPDLSKVSISGAGNIYIRNKFISNDLTVWSSGSGSIIIDSLKIDELFSNVSGSGNTEINCLDSLTNVDVWSSGAGELDLENVLTLDATANLSGSGSVKMSPKNSLNGTISGSGSIYYNENYSPTIISNISGSGSIQSF